MKNKLYYIVLSIFSVFAFMNSVFAEGDLSFSIDTTVVGGETTVVKGSEATIYVSLISNTALSSCTFNVTSDTGIEFVSKKAMNNYLVKDEGENIVVERTNTDVAFASGENAFELKYKINNNGKLTIKTVNCKSTDEKTGTTTDKVIEFKTKESNDDTSLKSLTIIGGALDSIFNSNVYNYTAQLNDTKFGLNMIASNSDYQDKIVVTDGEGNVLNPNEIVYNSVQDIMAITITVNNKTKYEIGVRYVKQALDNSLSSLKIGDETIKLESGKYDYNVKVGKNISSVKIEAVLKDSNNFRFVEGNGPTVLQVSSSSTAYALMIEPKDSSSGGTGQTYMITVTKEGASSSIDKPSSTPNKPTSSNNNGNATTNPTTGGISMFLMAFILIASLIGSMYLYQKNLEGYNK